MRNKLHFIIIAFLSLCCSFGAFSQTTWTAKATGNWNAAATWTVTGTATTETYPGQNSGNNDVVVIPTGTFTVTLNVNITSTSITSVTVTSGSTLAIGAYTLTITGATGNLTGTGTVTISTGTITAGGSISATTLTCTGAASINVSGGWSVTTFTKSTSTVSFKGTGAQSVTTATSFYNLIVNNSGLTLTLSAADGVTGAFTLTAGTVVNSSTFTCVAAAITGTFTNSSTFTATGIVTVNGTFTNNGTATLSDAVAGALTGSGTWTQGSGSTLTYKGTTITLTTVNFSTSTNTVAYNGASPTILNTSYNNFTFSGSGTITPSSALTITGNLVVSSGTLALGALTQSVTGTVSGAGTITISTGTLTTGGAISVTTLTCTGAASINPGGNWSVGSFTPSTSAVTFAATSSITAGGTFYNLIINGSGITTTLTSSITVAGNLTITAGTLQVAGLNITVTGTTSVSGTFSDNSNTGTNTFTGGVTINSGGTWSTATSTTTGTYVFKGGITNAGTFTGGGVTFSTNAQSLSGTGGFSFAGIVTSNVVLTNNTTVSITSTAAASLAGTGSWVQANGSTLNYKGSTMTITTPSFSTATNTVAYNGAAAQTILATTYNNLTYSGTNTGTLSGTTTVNGNLVVSSGTLAAVTYTLNVTGSISGAGTLSVSTGTLTSTGSISVTALSCTGAASITTSGSWSVTTFTKSTSTVTFNGTGAQSISTATSFNNLTVNNSGITLTLSAVDGVTGTFTLTAGTVANSSTFTCVTAGITGTFTNSSSFSATGVVTVNGTFTNNGTATLSDAVTGALTGSGTWAQGSASTLNYKGTTITITTPSFSTATNTVAYNGASAQTILATTYGNLTYSGSSTGTLAGTTTVNGSLVVSSGTLALSTYTLNVTGTSSGAGTLSVSTGTLTSTGSISVTALSCTGAASITTSGSWSVTTFTKSTSTVTFNGTGAQSISTATSFNNLTVNNSGITLTLSAVDGVTGTFTLTAGTVANSSTFTCVTASITGTFTNSSSFSATGVVTVNGTFTNNGTATLSDAVAGALTGSGTWSQGSASTLNYKGTTITITTPSFSTATNTVAYNGAAAQTILATTYNNLTYSGSNTGTLAGTTTVNGSLVVSSGTLALSTYTLNVTGSISGAGTLSVSTGTLASTGSISVTTLTCTGAASITTAGSWSVTTFTKSTSTVTFNGTGAQSISKATSFNNLTVNNSGITLTLSAVEGVTGIFTLTAGTVTNSSTFTCVTAGVTGTFTNSSSFSATGVVTVNGTLTNNGTATLSDAVTGALAGTGTWTQGSSSTLTYAGTTITITTPSFSTATNTVAYNGAAAQTILATTYNNLTYSGSNTGTLAGTTTVSGNLTVSSGTLAGTSSTINLTGNLSGAGALSFTTGALNIAGNNTLSGTFTAGTGTVTYNGASSQTVLGATYYNLILNGAGAKTLGAAGTVGGTLTLTSGILTTTTTNKLTITNTSAAAVSGGTTTSFINGPFYRTLPASLSSSASVYSFPVGNGTTYLPYSITTITTGATGPVLAVTATTAGSGGSVDATLVSLSTTEYWTSSVFSGNFTSASVSMTRQSALGTLDAIGYNASSVTGTYTSLAGTVSGTSVNNSNTTGAGYFSFGFLNCSPSTQATALAFTTNASQTILTWTNGNGTARLVVAKKSSAITGIPTQGTSYTANAVFGSGGTDGTAGEYIVYNGTGNTVTVTGLSAGNTYYFQVFEYTTCTFPVYKTSTATGNPASTTTTGANTYYSIASQDWQATGTWSLSSGGAAVSAGIYPGINDNVVVERGYTVTAAETVNCLGLSIAASSGLSIGSNTLNVNGNVSGAGNLSATSGTFNFAGNNTLSGTFTCGTSTVNYTGSSPVMQGTTYYNLVLNGTGTASFNTSPATVNANLTITAGTIGAGASTLNLTGNLSGAGALSFTTGTFTIAGSNVLSGTFTPGTGTVVYNGSASQTVLGTTYNNLTMNGVGAKTLGAPAIVNGTLTLTSGILTTTATNTLTIASTTAGAVSGGSTSSFINGPLYRTLPGSLTASASVYNFPVGVNATYLPYSMTTITTGTTSPVISVVASNSISGGTVDATLISLSTTEYWTSTVLSGNFTSASVSLARQTSLGTLDAIAYNSTSASGTYTSIAGTVSGNAINTSSVTGAGYFVMAVYNCAPSTQATSISSTALSTAMVLTWTNGNGSNRIVVAKQGSPIVGTPTQETSYTANSVFASGSTDGTAGEYVIYNGTGNAVTVTGLSASTTYYFQVFDYNTCGVTLYNTSSSTGNPYSNSTTGANTYYSIASQDWQATGTWSLSSGGSAVPAGFYPQTNDTAIVQSGFTVTAGETIACANLTITSPSALSLGSNSLTISNNLYGNGTLSFTTGNLTIDGNNYFTGTITPGTGTVTYTGNSPSMQSTTYYNLVLNGSGTASFLATPTVVNGNLTITNDTLNLNSSVLTVTGAVTGTGTITLSSGALNATGSSLAINSIVSTGSSNINVAGNWSVGNFTPLSGTVTFNGTGTSTVSSGATFNNLIVNGSGTTIALATATTISGNLTVTAGTLQAQSSDLTVTGSANLTGTFTDNNASGNNTFQGLVTLNAGAVWNSSITSNCYFEGGISNAATSFSAAGITFNTNAQSITGASPYNFSGPVTVDNVVLTNNATTVNMNYSSGEALVGAGSWVQGSGSTLNYAGDDFAGISGVDFHTNANTINYNGAVQNIFSTSYSNLTCSDSATATLAGDISVSNNLLISSGELDQGSYTIQMTGSGTSFTNNASFSSGTGLVNFNGTGTQTIAGSATSSFYNLTVGTNLHTLELTANASLVNTLSVTNNATFNTNGKTFTLLSTTDLNNSSLNGGGTAQISDLTNGTVTGNVVWQRYIDGNTDWRVLACPIQGATIANLTSGYTTGSTTQIYTSGFSGSSYPSSSFVSMYTFNPSTQGYVAPTSSSNAISANTASSGFLTYVGNTNPGTSMTPITLSLTGSIISGTQTHSIASVNGDYNLLQNPYPAPLSFSSFQSTNSGITNTYYVYDEDAGGYVSFILPNLSASGRTNGVIASGQAFFAISNGGSSSVTFQESHKASGIADGNFLKLNASNTYSLHLTISSATATRYKSSALIQFSPEGQPAYNATEDAVALAPYEPSAPTISSYSSDGKDLEINSTGLITQNLNIPIRATVGVSGTYTISSSSLTGANACVILYDKLTNTSIDLTSVNSYTFTISDTTKAPRFVLQVSGAPVTAVTPSGIMRESCSNSSDAYLIATPTSSGLCNYIWKDSTGNIVRSDSAKATADTLSNVAPGKYTVTVSNGSTCSSTGITQAYTVTAPTPVLANFTPSTTNIFAGDSIQFVNTSSGANSYQWSFGDGQSSTQMNITHTYMNPGTYTVQLAASNGACTSPVSAQVVNVNIPTGIGNVMNANTLNAYSNAGIVYVKSTMTSGDPITVEVYDIVGKLMSKNVLAANPGVFQLNLTEKVNTGIYLVKLTSGSWSSTQRVYISE